MLLGTGTPMPRMGRFGASTLVEAGSEKLLFDLGRGATIRLFQKRMRSVRSGPTSPPICIPTTSSACPTCS